MTQLNDISLAFDDIIDTPAKRRRQVEEASQQLRQRYAQSQLPFSLLGAGIAGSLPGITENLRRGLRDVGGTAFKTQGENIAEQLRGIDTSTVAGQNQVLAIISQVDPGRAEALKQMFDQKNIEAEQRQFERAKFAELQRSALITEDISRTNAETARINARTSGKNYDQRVAEFNAKQMEGENLAAYNRGIAAQFAPTLADGTPNPQANPQWAEIYSSAAANNIPHAAIAQTIDAISSNRSDVERELQIQAIANDTGMSEEAAENLLFQMDNGIIEVDISEDGQVTVVDIAQSMANAASGSAEKDAVTRLSPGVYEPIDYGFDNTLYSMAPYIPGVINKIQTLWNRTGAQLDPTFFAEREATAEALVNDVALELYAATREMLGSGRLSDQMVERIEASIGIKGKVWDSERNYRVVLRMNSERLRAVGKQLRSELEQGVYTDAGRRSDAQTQLSAVEKAIQKFGVPEIIAVSEFTPELINISDVEVLQESIAAMGPANYSLMTRNNELDKALEAKGL